jgi:hypothetical protein
MATLKGMHEREGEYQTLKYRQYRGVRFPVYRDPMGLGLIQKERGELRWRGWATVMPRLLTDMLILLGTGPQTYLAVQERREGRVRWVDGIGLQTKDPAVE